MNVFRGPKLFRTILVLALISSWGISPLTAMLQQNLVAKNYPCDESTSTQDLIKNIFNHVYEFNKAYESDLIDHRFKNFASHVELCGQLPISYESFIKLLQQNIKIMQQQFSEEQLLEIENNTPYGQAVIVSAGHKIITIGDLHGNVHSLARTIKRLNNMGFFDDNYKLKPHVTLVFMGDIGDRGHYSTETWSLVLTLKKANPSQVIILKGNHETEELFQEYGFAQEIKAKYREQKNSPTPEEIRKIFKLLPQVLFVGHRTESNTVSFFQVCHGGLGTAGTTPLPVADITIEVPTFINPVPLLQTTCLHQKADNMYHTYFFQGCNQETGFIWNDFHAKQRPYDKKNTPHVGFSKTRQIWFSFDGPYVHSYLNDPRHPVSLDSRPKALTEDTEYNAQSINTKELFTLDGIIRGHDHLDHGVNQLNQNQKKGWSALQSQQPVCFCKEKEYDQPYPVYTITSAPELNGSDACAILEFNEIKNQWAMTPYIFDVPTTTPSNPELFHWTPVDDDEGEICTDGVRWKVFIRENSSPAEQ